MTSDDTDEVIFRRIKNFYLCYLIFVVFNFQCPLCMEPFEVDDMSFYPCTCGYQV